MTVHLMPVRQRRDAETETRPVPWPRMIWVTWRQHRGLLIGILAAFLAAAVAMLVAGLRIHQDYAALAACHPSAAAACAQLSNYFGSTDWHEGNGIHVAVQAAPVLLALFAGPPVLAREFENGTYRYAWTQGIGRVRWTVTKLALLGAVVTATALVLSLECTWLFVTLAAYLALVAVTWFYLRGHYPVSTFWPMQLFESAWLLALSAALTAATPRLVRHSAA